MVFSSIPFLFYFLPLVLIAYFALPKQWKNAVLLVFSLLFYAWGEPVYILLMLFSIIMNFVLGEQIEKARLAGKPQVAKTVFILTVILNLGLLGFFKYTDFLIESLNGAFSLGLPTLDLPLPIGISFYTFQALSYIIDLYNGKVGVQKNIVGFGAYISLFPQLIAGPIVRLQTVASELTSRQESVPLFSDGVKRFICGLAKKVLLANVAGEIFTKISEQNIEKTPLLTAWIGIIAFTFQIYYDFSGYSDMAIGLGKMFGFHFLENFDYPYISASITEFWRRWHISLSTWFKEYVYIPLGGNKKGLARQIRNILIVWTLTGIWHGASWNFVVWGVYFASILIAEKLIFLKWLERLPRFVGHVYALLLIVFGWVIFGFDSVTTGLEYFRSLFGMNANLLWNTESLYLLLSNLLLFVIMAVGSTPLPKKLYTLALTKVSGKITNEVIETTVMAGGFMVCIAFLVDQTYNPFLYFRF